MLFLFQHNELSETSSVLRIRGSDAYTYLQGQFTQDLNRPIGSSSYGLWLNQRGKVVADSFVLRVNDNDFIAVSEATPAEVIRKRLESYIVADDVNLTNETPNWSVTSIWGDGAGAQIERMFGAIPNAGGFVQNQHGFVICGRISEAANFLILAPRSAANGLVRVLTAEGARAVEAAALVRERVQAGIPAVPADLGPDDLPNEGGIEDSAISHTKGCYLGQEVMARLKNLGQVRRRLFVVRGTGGVLPSRTPLFQGGKKIGETRSAAPDENGFVAMAMLGLLHLDPAAGLALALDASPEIQIVRRV